MDNIFLMGIIRILRYLIFNHLFLYSIYTKETPDVICNALNFCKNSEQNECRVFPKPKVEKTIAYLVNNYY
jgi:hypothetical protein